jgi:hypothetical protein
MILRFILQNTSVIYLSMGKAPTWNRIKKKLMEYDSSDLIETIKLLYDLSKQNQALLMGLVDQEASLEAMKAPVVKAIAKAFDPPRGFPSFKPAEAKKAVYQFVKLAPKHEGIEMMLLFVQSGVQATTQYGDIDEGFYRSLEDMWENTLELILQYQGVLGVLQYQLPKLRRILATAQGFGWGFTDQMNDLFALFLEKLEVTS